MWPKWAKKAAPARAVGPATSSNTGGTALTAQKYGLGVLLGLLCVVDVVAALLLVVAAANLRRAASADEHASEVNALAVALAVLAAYIAIVAAVSLVSARVTGSVTRLQRAGTCLLRSAGLLLVPQAFGLICLCCYTLVRGSTTMGRICSRNEADESRGYFPAASELAAAFAVLALLSLLRACVGLKLNSAVKRSAQRYAEMADLEGAADTAARQARMASISAKHQALREKYAARGYIQR